MERRERTRRIKKRKNMKRRRNIFFLFIILMLLAIFYRLGAFRIDSIKISGNNIVKKSEIERALDIEEGVNYLILGKKEKIKKVLKIPYIKSVKFSYRPFKRILKVDVEEREEFGIVIATSNYLVDRELKILKEVKGTRDDLISIFGIDTNKYEIGAFLFRNDEALKELSKKLIESDIIYDIKSMKFYKTNVDFTLKDGILVKFGPIDKFDYKMKLLSKIRDDIKNTGKDVVSIDLFTDENPVVLLKES